MEGSNSVPPNLEGIEEEIKNIENFLGEKRDVLDKMFDKNMGYTKKDLEDQKISDEELSEYADLCLGIKIRDCIKKKGECNIEAEI